MLNTKWFTGFKGDRAKLEEVIRASSIVRDRLTEIISQELEQLQSNPTQDYSLPSWAYFQADKLGQIKALTNILKLTQLESDQS